MMDTMNDGSASEAGEGSGLGKSDILSLYSIERQDSASSAVILLAQYSAGITFIAIVSGFLLSNGGVPNISPLLLIAPIIPLGLFIGVIQRIQSNEIRDRQLRQIEERLRELGGDSVIPGVIEETWMVWHPEFTGNGRKRKEQIMFLLSMITIIASPVIILMFVALIAWSVRSHGFWVWLVAAFYGVAVVLGTIAGWPASGTELRLHNKRHAREGPA